MRSGAKFGLLPVGITLFALIGCGGVGKTSSSETRKTEFVDSKPVKETQDSGVVTCSERTLPEGMPKGARVFEVELKGEAEKVLSHSCSGESSVSTEFGTADLTIDELSSIGHADIVIMRNRTTCTERLRIAQSDRQAAEIMGGGAANVVGLSEFKNIAVLPVGRLIMDPPKELSLDPGRENLIEVEAQNCDAWGVGSSGEKVCTDPKTITKFSVVVKVKVSGRYLRGVRMEKAADCK